MNTNLRITLTTLIAVLFLATSFAQVGRIETTTFTNSDKDRVDALMVSMRPERKDIQKAFDDWIDDRYDINMKGGGLFSDKNTRRAETVSIPGVTADNINVFTYTEERNGETKMYLYASRGAKNYINRDEYAAFTGLENIFDSFLSSYLPEYYEERVEEATDALADLQKDLKDNKEDYAKNEKRIQELREENEELEAARKALLLSIEEAERTLKERKNARNKVNRELGSGI